MKALISLETGVLPGTALSSVSVKLKANPACIIGSTEYETFGEALAAVTDGQTITLLQDIDYSFNISISDKDIVFDIGDFDLNVNFTATMMSFNALFVNNGSVSLDTTGGNFNITCNSTDGYGVYVSNGGSAEVSNVTALNSYGVFNLGGGTVSVSGNVQAGNYGVYVSEGTVLVEGDVEGGYYGTYAHNNGTVNISGDSTGNTFNGIFAASGAQVTIDGDVLGSTEGAYSEGTGTSIIIGGNVSSTNSTGAYANTGLPSQSPV